MYNFYFKDSITSHLNTNQKWVIRHLIYAKGIGNVINRILPLIKNKQDLDSVLLHWNYYVKNGERIESKFSTRIRKAEIYFWHNDTIVFK